jgi:hypothetical protein
MRAARPTSNHRTRRRVLATATTAATLATIVSIHVASADTPPACTLEPAADGMPLGPQLVDTVRPTPAGEAVLHRLECPGAATRWIWLRTSPGAGGPIVVATVELQPIGPHAGA